MGIKKKMKILKRVILLTLTITITKSILLKKTKSDKNEERKLYENTTSSYLLGDSIDAADTSHLSLLVSQQKAMENFKVIGNWLNDVESKLDDLRDSVNRRVSDMAIGLQRRNMLLGHYNSLVMVMVDLMFMIIIVIMFMVV